MVAHQGGWDEILMVVAPLAIIGGLLWLANRRVTAQLEAEQQAGEGPQNGKPAAEKTGKIEKPKATDKSRRTSGGDGQD